MINLTTTYSPQNAPSNGLIKVALLSEIEGVLSSEESWFLDVETYPKDWGESDAAFEYTQKVKNVSKGNFAKFYAKQRMLRAVDPKRNTIRLLQIRTRDHIFVLDTHNCNIKNILRMIPNKRICGHNIKFDLMTIYKYLGERVVPKEIYDTMVGHQLMSYQRNPMKQFNNGYKDIIKAYFKIDLSKESQSAEWDGIITSEMWEYSYKDVLYLPEAMMHQTKYLNKQSSNKCAPYFKIVKDEITRLEMDFIKVCIDLELEGVPVNQQGLRDFKYTYEADLQKSFDALGDLNANSSKQLVAYLKSKGGIYTKKVKDKDGKMVEKETADKPTLLKNLEIALVPEILQNRSLRKLDGDIDKYAEGEIAYANFRSIEGFTGRMSAKDLPLQTIPRKIKKVFYKNNMEDKVILSCDLPNIEARVAAQKTKDPTLLRLFRDGEDMHIKTAQEVLGVRNVTDEERSKAKPVNFGFIFGQGAQTFQAYAFDNYGILFSIEECHEYRRLFMEVYAGIFDFHNENSARLREERMFITKSLYGRRMIVDKFTNANNYPVQSSAADILKLATLRIWETLDRTQARIINLVHDDIIVITTKKYKAVASKILKDGLEWATNSILTEFHTTVVVDEI